MKLRTAILGCGGFAHRHAANLVGQPDKFELVAVCDRHPERGQAFSDRYTGGRAAVVTDHHDLFDKANLDLCVICLPPYGHSDEVEVAAAHGVHLLLEKPPTPTYDDFEALLADVDASGLTCQVGFQSLGSPAVDRIRELVRSGAVGEVVGIGAEGAWVRERAYYDRGRWAGRRSLDGVPVVDGVLTNPLAHSVSAALRIDGSETPDAVRDVAVELYRAHDIEADDTSCLRLRTRRGTVITVAATLCATRTHEPVVTVHGTRGRIALAYKRGEVRVRTDDRAEEVQVSTHPPVPLLENLVAHLQQIGFRSARHLVDLFGRQFAGFTLGIDHADAGRGLAAAHQRQERHGQNAAYAPQNREFHEFLPPQHMLVCQRSFAPLSSPEESVLRPASGDRVVGFGFAPV